MSNLKTAKKVHQYNSRHVFKSSIGIFLVFIIALTLFILAFGKALNTSRIEATTAAEAAVRRAAITCYALEGYYPESYEHLKVNYSLRLNENYYKVHYNTVASNIMPDITITSVN